MIRARRLTTAAAAAPARLEVQDGREARSLGPAARMFLPLSSLITFMGFMYLDPEPSLLLSICAAANVALMLFSIYRLYQWNLLLSPIASVVIGPGQILYYSLGNLGARIAQEGRHAANPGSLEFYPIVALLTTIGLALFAWIVFGLLPRPAWSARLRYEGLRWQPWQAPAAGLLAVGLLFYLSSKYEFVNGYFRNVDGNFDRWLSASQYFFVILAVIIGVSVLLRARSLLDAALGFSGVVVPLLLAVGLRSRTSMIEVIVTAMLCWITLRPRQVRFVLLAGALGATLIFVVGTVVKAANLEGQTTTVTDNLLVVTNTDLEGLAEYNRASAAVDISYRTAGFELPAALVGAYVRGAPPMYGGALVGGFMSGLPGFIRPEGNYTERLAIFRHFHGRGLRYGDSIGVPLTSGLADWGIVAGPLIYAAIAVYCLVVWRVVQFSPRLFVAYLMAGASAGDLFWEDGLFAVRAIGFAWLVLVLAGPLLAPRWLPDPTGRPAHPREAA